MSEYEVPAGTNYADAIRDMIKRRLPDVSFAFPPTDRVTPRLVYPSVDLWDAEELANAIGMTLSLEDNDTRCVMREMPDLDLRENVRRKVLSVVFRVIDAREVPDCGQVADEIIQLVRASDESPAAPSAKRPVPPKHIARVFADMQAGTYVSSALIDEAIAWAREHDAFAHPPTAAPSAEAIDRAAQAARNVSNPMVSWSLLSTATRDYWRDVARAVSASLGEERR